MINFEDLSYLRSGNVKQRLAFDVLTKNSVFELLGRFDPLLAGTIPIGIDTDESDLDVICCFSDEHQFVTSVKDAFGSKTDFKIRHKESVPVVVANFLIDNFKIEIFGQAMPSAMQPAFRHMLLEHMILEQMGADFRAEVIELKKRGYKTEPAFAHLLRLDGNPYEALHKYELLFLTNL